MDDTDLNRLYEVACMYHEDGMGQAAIADSLGVSRPTVSRMLSRARAIGMVRVQVVPPGSADMTGLAAELAEALGLRRAFLAPGAHPQTIGRGMERAVQAAVLDMELRPGDSVVVASGMATSGVADMQLTGLQSAVLVPGVGGAHEPELWHQPNETVRRLAEHSGASYTALFAEAVPSPAVYEALQVDDSFRAIRGLWANARGALLGVGARTTGRVSISRAIPQDALPDSVGDVCLHFFDRAGRELSFPGSERTIHISTEQLLRIPRSTAIAVGAEKVLPVIVAARRGLFRSLVTDTATAELILAEL
ncbi:hypothetical protein CFRA_05590 [Corynebacterium frankenforstense DSM 45800]|uniref:Sugar-binding domain-containing protein n=1 Tax=Corynebacterium frankenforstense DSM 45800 TaxID=1437875 RepID=A0A1L7CSH3_9CORY|nr:sugar-binding domain-containing protein [Corynebacterium frankenforstense]APT88804.1 hypothetical protein CFRA_05590 [Corynebacterium frankenforstense DSM 45800]